MRFSCPEHCRHLGLGLFPYGSLLRTARVYEARHFKGMDDHIASKLCNPVKIHPVIESEPAQQYFRELGFEFRGPMDGMGSGGFYTQQYKGEVSPPKEESTLDLEKNPFACHVAERGFRQSKFNVEIQ